MFFSWLLLPWLFANVALGNGQTPNELSVELHSQWGPASFELNLLESITEYDPDLYIPTILELLGLNDEGDEEPLLPESTNSEKYNHIMSSKLLSLGTKTKAFINYNFVNKINYPRVQAHHDFYKSIVQPEFGERIVKECSVDSFGNKVKRGPNQPWVLYNNKLYCSSDDLYALQTDKATKFKPRPFDRVIGDNYKAPLLILYGDINAPSFADMFSNLYESAKTGKIRFIWRYTPSTNSKKSVDTLSGFGVDVSLKRNDYVVIDDRDIKNKKGTQKGKPSKPLNINKDLWKILQTSELKPVSKQNFNELSSKLTSLVLLKQYNNITEYDLLNLILSEFPKLASYIGEATNLRHLKDIEDQFVRNRNAGLSDDSYGLYINGAPLHSLELDSLNLMEKIEDELSIIHDLKSLGLTPRQAKFLIKKFALLSAVKQTQFRNGNTVMGHNENRFRVYENVFTAGGFKRKRGVVFLNDIEKDNTYEEYSKDRKEVYLGPVAQRLKPNQLPPLKENVHDLIFALNFNNKEQLKVLFTLSKMILDSGIPQQVGIIAIDGGNELDRVLAEKFYFIADTSNSQEALAFLYKYLESKDSLELSDLLETIRVPEDYGFDHAIYQNTLEKFSIVNPSIIFNGVIYELTSPNWQIAMGKQLSQDIVLLKQHISSGKADGKSLKSILYQGSKSTRNLRIIPADPADVMYKFVDSQLIDASVALKPHRHDRKGGVSGTFWLIGDFNKQIMIDQLKSILSVMKWSKETLQVRILNTGHTVKEIEKLAKQVNLHELTGNDIDWILTKLNTIQNADAKLELNLTIAKLLETKKLPVHHEFLLFNSRYFRLDRILAETDLELLVEYEYNQRFLIFNDLINAYPEEFNYKVLDELNPLLHDNLDWFDLLASVVTRSFYDDKFYVNDVGRFDFSTINMEYSLNITNQDSKMLEPELEFLLIIDPLDDYSQKVVSIINSVKDFPFVSTRILLQPREDENESVRIKRFYKGVYPRAIPEFDDKGKWISENTAQFFNLPTSEIFTVELDTPQKWITVTKDSPEGVDLDNIKFDNLDESLIHGVYELKNILIEGYARDVKTAAPSTGVALEISQGDAVADTQVMSSMGYFQLPSGPGTWRFRIKNGGVGDQFELLSATESKFVMNNVGLESVNISVFDLKGKTIYPRLQKTEKKVNRESTNNKKHADINIFTIASGHLYERFLSIMTASVRKHTDHLVKFWIIENFISANLKQLLPHLAEKYQFEYELITYKWPSFLRAQREKQRTIWGYKMLFLDVLFPQDLDKVIFVDADQIVRTDMMELVTMDLEGAPYGFTPMCDSRDEMDGFRFWKQGYWSEVLGSDLKYHISALYVVDLRRFREINAGDLLRSHYQKLSLDPNSLANLDQDLPNNLQRKIPIFSLPQDWLWCETWCSDATMATAKTIDLCNNPLTKENKLERARRLIPEWEAYDAEIAQVLAYKAQLDHDQAQLDQDLIDYISEDETEPAHDTWDEDPFEHDEL
ncbi:glycosyltransferase family 24 protein [Suhomyces tanzawaensis NRRL Y-17324]|uniref:Glycosyltransferase family 24 protein n=1 Tax=Suhomyces tanzawaensis NRRL Y-17324 TaxID=984487 RepID=A0A1E4SFY6_9ASCO|nr:glycosyltransferase family 24 protein [Suhomyces tanzawaensis NRRL Y-17324]ODV78429.1 glycosyltransferase family 24 protein [Suhomyces tanzawaensis NRRL Y-17324]